MLSEKAMVVVFSDVGDIYFLCFLVQEEGIMLLKVFFFLFNMTLQCHHDSQLSYCGAGLLIIVAYRVTTFLMTYIWNTSTG